MVHKDHIYQQTPMTSNFSILSVKALAHSNYAKLEVAAFTESQNG